MALWTPKTADITLKITVGSNQIEVPGLTDISQSGGEADTRELRSLAGSVSRTGEPGVPTIELSGYHLPLNPALLEARDAFYNQTNVTVEIEVPGEIVFPVTTGSNTVTIADTTGVCTFAGTAPKYADVVDGLALQVTGESQVNVIEQVTASSITVDGAASNLPISTGALYSIVIPPLTTGQFQSAVSLGDNYEISAEGDMTFSITLAPLQAPPAFGLNGLVT